MPEIIASYLKPNAQVDCHVLTCGHTKQEWLDRCLNSLESEPCNVFVIRGVDGHIGQGRAFGYSQGSAPYVTFVDDDDYVIAGVIGACLTALNNYDAVVTKEYVEYADGSRYRLPVSNHHLVVYRRVDIEPLITEIAAMPYRSERMIRTHIRPESLDFIGYVWNVAGHRSHDIRADANGVPI